MTDEPPEFHTKSSTPLSPLPLHPPEPSKIPVLRNQIDPVFNMTSTHIDPTDTSTTLSPASAPTSADALANASAVTANEDIDANDSGSLSDPFDDTEKQEEDSVAKLEKPPIAAADADDDDDDYAMTFETDAEEETSKQDISNAEVQEEKLSTSSPPSASEQVLSTPLQLPINAAAPLESTTSKIETTSPVTIAPATSAMAAGADDSTQSQYLPNTVVANGEIDIQQLLDNITASAELSSSNANSANAQPTIPGSSIFPPNPPSLPTHASLPPRPQVSQTSAMTPAYASQEDVQRYQTGPPGYPPSSLSSYRPPGASGSFIATGAPGTSTDSRNVLLPPPPASFTGASVQAPPVTASAPYTQSQRVLSQDRTAKSVESPEPSEDAEVQWSPAVQKLYDEFLADERMYVTEGLWDRFPAGSRLFIGIQLLYFPQKTLANMFLQAIYPLKRSRSVISSTFSTHTADLHRFPSSKLTDLYNSTMLLPVILPLSVSKDRK